MLKKILRVVCIATVCLSLGACMSMGKRETNGALGAAAGGVIGSMFGGGYGSALLAGVGAGARALVGYNADQFMGDGDAGT